MAGIPGKGSNAKLGSSAIECVESWDGSFEVDELDDTSMGDTAGATVAGLQQTSFSISCKRDTAATQQNSIIAASLAGTEQTFTLLEDSTNGFTGKARPKTKIAANVKGIVMLTITGKVSDGNAWTRVP